MDTHKSLYEELATRGSAQQETGNGSIFRNSNETRSSSSSSLNARLGRGELDESSTGNGRKRTNNRISRKLTNDDDDNLTRLHTSQTENCSQSTHRKRLSATFHSIRGALICLTLISTFGFLILMNQCDTCHALQQSNGGGPPAAGDQAGPVKKCPVERDIEMDKCASSLGFLGDRTFVMPKNGTQMNNFCGTLTKSLKCIQNYARECLSSFPRQVLLTVTRNGRKQYNQLCENERSKQEFMDKLQCLEPSNLEQLHQCMDGSIARFEYVANQVEADNRISAICCSYQIFRRDIQETVEKTCSSYPRVNQTAHYLHEIISTTTGELIELVCGAYKTFEECKAKPKMASLVSTFTEITTKTKTKQIKPRAKSLISLFVNILNSF